MKHEYRFSSRHQRPEWWPENVDWPPRSRHWRGARNPFFRRIGCLFVAFNLLGFTLTLVAVGFLLNLFGLIHFSTGSLRWLLPIGLGFLACGLVLIVLAGRNLHRLSAPLDDLLAASNRVADSDYSVRVEEKGPREVRSLARAFNVMATRLQEHDHQRRDLLADVTHELRTPLTIIQGNLEGMLDGIYAADDAQLKLLMDETHLLSRLVDDLRTLALAESGSLVLNRASTDLSLLIRETLQAFHAQAAAARVRLDFQEQNGPLLNIDPERIRQVLTNLIGNALRYTPPEGLVAIRTDVSQHSAENFCAVTVSDSGPGVPAADLPHIFERFHKSSDSGGMGLGLSIAKSLVEAHGGKIEAHSRPGQGTEIRFTLPFPDSDDPF